MGDGLGAMKQYGTFSNAAPVFLQRPSDDTRNMQLHRCISMSLADDPVAIYVQIRPLRRHETTWAQRWL